jgi:hypothetical protein
MDRTRRPLADRLWEKVDRSGGPDACWLYQIDHDNYGNVGFFQEDGTFRVIGAHRAAYLLTYGILSDTLYVLHRCPDGPQKRCCNPRHLYLGTPKENAADLKHDKNWSPGRRKLSNLEVISIRELYPQHPPKVLATMFGITTTSISEILRGHTYQDVGGPLKTSPGRQKSHCHNGHPLTGDNLVLTHGDKQFRQCRLCYMETNRVKTRKRLSTHRDLINAQRRGRRGSTVRRFTQEECTHIQSLYPAASYRELAEQFDTTYSTIQRIVRGTYGGTKLKH